MDALTYAISLNDEGVKHMLNGNDQTSSGFLRQSLSAFKQVLASLTVNGEEEIENAISSVGNCCLHRTDVSLSLPSLQEVSTNYDMTHFHLYSKPIVLTLDDAVSKSHLDPNVLNVCCASVVFNTALVYHSQALGHYQSASDGTSSYTTATTMAYLQKAQMFYNIVVKVLRALPPGNDNMTAALIQLASANNSSHLLYLQGDHDRTMQRLDWVSCLLQSGDDRICYVLNEKEQRGFLMNTFLVLCRQDLAPAA